uniref:Branched-chain-amino-acid aminotransferase n=2 Tax=Oncorhynchus tshawytscha TaxID=74940 RepID=A0AAZ3PI45_ONCTS
MMKLALMRIATGKEDPELPLLQRISSLELTAPPNAAQINASQSSSNRHISTSTVQRRLRESGLHGGIAAMNQLLKDTNNKKRLDETKFEIFGSNRRVFVRRRALHGRFIQAIPYSLGPLRFASSFKAADLTIERNTAGKPKPDPASLVFGKQFSDHMLTIYWSEKEGWKVPQIKPFQNLSLHPATSALHYSIELFEGMKAFRGVDNHIRLFRPNLNMERMHRTADRSCLPLFDKEELLECIRKLVEVDQDWVPYSLDASLYIRPTYIGIEPSLGVSRSSQALLFCIVGPVGPYFTTGAFSPVSLLADPSYVRACRGGVGAYKMGGNYGPTISVQNEAIKQGCQQVLWLYGEQEEITEVGTMNLFIYWTNEGGERELLTPPLDGIILPGVTRQSLLDLAREWGEFKVTERTMGMKELLGALDSGRITEVFGAGTACVVCPVGSLLYKGKTYQIPTMQNGPDLAKRFHKELTDMQYGRKQSEWAPLVV